jgi:TM2 domain-containing membrane protein YozV|nr:MAG: TM2 domain protein [Bacteriophage sp.]
MFGAHRYYVGKIGTGVIWTLTAGFFGIGWIVDIFTVALGGFYDANGYVVRFRPTDAELSAEGLEEDAPVDIGEE